MKVMGRTNDYKCPICNKGSITIEEDRVGEPGFRETEFQVSNVTCECITAFNTIIVLAIINYTNKEVEEGKACENCGDLEANIIYPTRPWVGESKDICSDCFKKEVAELNAS